ncbi:hypothetical protein FNU76_15495 [Chitinimonas arctica]|uniref:Uncharacterized protein n=1 Tax=Chitinimonas arctica TaxID=2594795 RepID=A0A516SHL6_9NEIS|nr:hypothetical protein [Chitinimonas arctica]QDQ27642.1 hypothetical protein FNU76_15495 [Chitinimonas arctica]
MRPVNISLPIHHQYGIPIPVLDQNYQPGDGPTITPPAYEVVIAAPPTNATVYLQAGASIQTAPALSWYESLCRNRALWGADRPPSYEDIATNVPPPYELREELADFNSRSMEGLLNILKIALVNFRVRILSINEQESALVNQGSGQINRMRIAINNLSTSQRLERLSRRISVLAEEVCQAALSEYGPQFCIPLAAPQYSAMALDELIGRLKVSESCHSCASDITISAGPFPTNALLAGFRNALDAAKDCDLPGQNISASELPTQLRPILMVGITYPQLNTAYRQLFDYLKEMDQSQPCPTPVSNEQLIRRWVSNLVDANRAGRPGYSPAALDDGTVVNAFVCAVKPHLPADAAPQPAPDDVFPSRRKRLLSLLSELPAAKYREAVRHGLIAGSMTDAEEFLSVTAPDPLELSCLLQ